MNRSRQRGQSLVETALVLPVVLILLMGLFDFGRAIFAYNTVAEAARNGARVAIVNQTPADICAVAAQRAVGLGLSAGCVSPGQVGVSLSPSSGCTAINCLQSVTVTYAFTPLTPIVSAFTGPITVNSTSTVAVESLCQNNGCPKP